MESYPSSVEKLSRRKSFSPFARLTNTWDSIIVSPYDSMRSRYVVFVIVMESRFIKLKAIPAQVFLYTPVHLDSVLIPSLIPPLNRETAHSQMEGELCCGYGVGGCDVVTEKEPAMS
ncbi:hypothetical protein Y032_0044g910 [Ancylostoma ceylanicum]|uniref:Uncharacterized protein n=1 Tax=Ancylostoma ceylanicum TaxID=53326 RepID=A0A016UD94_9BILA|nr:hypothetical protein Y032_0044g910 [Ancylostoma ceylanicum]